MCILRAICTAHSAVYWAPFSHVHIARDMRVVYTACRLCAICKAQLALISQHLHMPPVNDKRGAYCAQYVLIMHTAHIARNGQTVHIARNVKICILSAYRAQYAPFSVPCYAVRYARWHTTPTGWSGWSNFQKTVSQWILRVRSSDWNITEMTSYIFSTWRGLVGVHIVLPTDLIAVEKGVFWGAKPCPFFSTAIISVGRYMSTPNAACEMKHCTWPLSYLNLSF